METYKQQSKKARLKVLELIYKAQSSHIGSNFSVIDIFTVLFDKLDLTKDVIILSAGWKACAFYYFLAEKGYITKKELNTYCQKGSRLIGLTEPGVPGVRFAGGSMQMGFPASVGFALSKKMKGEKGKVYCIMSDGELNGGTTWEATAIASHHNLDNLVVIVDVNDYQAMGKTEDILKIGFPKRDFSIHSIDGHDHAMIERAIYATQNYNRSICFLAQTIKGKGVSFMEGQNLYHYKNLTHKEYLQAKKELNG